MANQEVIEENTENNSEEEVIEENIERGRYSTSYHLEMVNGNSYYTEVILDISKTPPEVESCIVITRDEFNQIMGFDEELLELLELMRSAEIHH